MIATPIAPAGLYAQEISARPPRTRAQQLNGIVCATAFLLGCCMVNFSQFIFLLPLRILPFPWARTLYRDGIRYTKGAYGNLLVLMCQCFGPTKLVITFESEGEGKLSPDEVERIVVRDAAGDVVGLRLPTKSALIANHQVYADWWYAWCLAHFAGTSKDIFIVLKRSLKWVPVLGWGMQFFNFIFLARSWETDRLCLSEELSKLGHRAEEEDIPLMFLLYPEGTLVSKDTRPISKKFADKMGIPDMTHTLLPRSTGLQYSLRSLAPRIPALQLVDITMAYPGIPPLGYGQAYYTLRSIFLDGVPPPAVHMHVRIFDVARAVPIGDVSASDPAGLPSGAQRNGGGGGSAAVEVVVPERERVNFEEWLQKLWREKDALMSRFLESGSFAGKGQKEVEIPLRLRKIREYLDAYCFFGPAVACYAWSKLRGL